MNNTYYGRYDSAISRKHFQASHTTYCSDAIIPPHEHGRSYFCLNIGAAFTEISGRSEIQVKNNDVVFHPPGHQHANRFTSNGGSCLNIEIGESWLCGMSDLANLYRPAYVTPRCHEIDARNLLFEFRNAHTTSSLVVDELLLSFFSVLSNSLVRRHPKAPQWLLRIRELLYRNYASTQRLDNLAVEAGVHPGHLVRTFRQCFGLTIGEYIRQRRIGAACKLIENGEHEFINIALMVGFSDQSSFSRTFRATVGLTATEYRDISGHNRRYC